MSDKKTTLTWLLRDQVSGTARKINGELGALGLKTKSTGLGLNLMTGALLGAGAALVGVMEKSAQEEVGIARLGASLRANVKDWDGNTDAIEQVITAREKLAFSDDELRGSLASLVGATHDLSKAWDIQAVAMDLARFKNISLEEASNALIKVEAGQYRLLKGLGITLKANATQTEALAAVEKVAAGQSTAYADTKVGKLKSLGIAWEDFLETVGGAAFDAAALADSAVKRVNDVLDFAPGIEREIGHIDKAMLQVGHAITDPVVDAVGVSVEAVGTLPGKIANAIRAGNDDVGSAAAGLVDAMKTPFYSDKDLQDITTGKGNLGKLVAKGLRDARPTVREATKDLVDTAKAELARRQLSINIGIQASGTAVLPGRAAGGPVAAGHAYRVGEHGEETLVMGGQSGTIIPNGGGMGVQIVGVSAAQLADMIDRELYFKLNRASPSAVRK